MKKILRYTLIVLFLFVNHHACQTIDSSFIPADNADIQYTGRINFKNRNAPIIYWPGTSIIANFEGTSIKVKLNDKNGENYFNVFIDNDTENPIIIACKKGLNIYDVASGLKKGIHKIEVFKRTETWEGPTIFYGFILDGGKSLKPPPQKSGLRIEFYGNSITSGMGNEDFVGNDNQNSAKKNNYLAYGAITARKLNAQYHCISKSGIGIMISWFNQVMPEFYNRLDPDADDEETNSQWNFKSWIPDIVVINLFQNDSWLVEMPEHEQFKKRFPEGTAPKPNEIEEAYISFVRTIRAKYPRAHIICALGNMDATKVGKAWPGYIRNAVDKIRVIDKDNRIYTCFFPFKNTPAHPTVRENEVMATQLTMFIKKEILKKSVGSKE